MPKTAGGKNTSLGNKEKCNRLGQLRKENIFHPQNFIISYQNTKGPCKVQGPFAVLVFPVDRLSFSLLEIYSFHKVRMVFFILLKALLLIGL
jgi:hypothetical protein